MKTYRFYTYDDNYHTIKFDIVAEDEDSAWDVFHERRLAFEAKHGPVYVDQVLKL